MSTDLTDRPFGELPAALVDEVLKLTERISGQLSAEFQGIRSRHQEWRSQLMRTGLLRRDTDLPYVSIPTTCGVDGSYAIERLLASDLAATAAVAVEGLTPPSETRHWPEPRHLVLVEDEAHEAETGTILRALMIGMELELAANAPHEVIFLDGSLTTPFIYFNQALNKSKEAQQLSVTSRILEQMEAFLEAYNITLSSKRTDRCWIAIPKYTTRREIGEELAWPETHDDRALLSFLLEPGEFIQPRTLQQPPEPWHLNMAPVSSETKKATESLVEQVIALLQGIRVTYYRPYPWLPALRLEMSQAVAENPPRIATALHAIRHQCGTPAVMEPYPLYMADRMVKHLAKAIPTFRQVASQRIAETYQGDIGEVFLGLHGYRTESGV